MMSFLNLDVISLIAGISVFLIIALIGVLIVARRKSVVLKETGDKSRDMYEEYIGGDIQVILKKLGINPSEYVSYCKIVNIQPDYYSLILFRIAGLAVLFSGVVAGILLSNYYIMVVAMFLGLITMNGNKNRIKKDALRRKELFNLEIPRFLDMLHSALAANIPIQSAIEFTVEHLDGVLAEEMKYALAETEMGAKSWNEALFDVANKYENNNFSDFALDLTTAYNKGTSVEDSVARKSRQIKDSNMLTAKEKATGVASKVLVPVVIFKMIPLLGAMLIPILLVVSDAF